ncbi:MAG: hypothetical protein ACT4N4_05780 [Rhodospirillales bacterium]
MHRDCPCRAWPSRRAFLGGGLAVAALACLPGRAGAAYGDSEFMLLSCKDPRLVHDVHEQMEARNLRGEYSQVALAGGPAAAVAPAFKKWQAAIWDNLGATIKLHDIKRVFGLTHLDCGAVRIAYGAEAVTPQFERATHIRILRAFRAEVSRRHPALGCETGIMALNGSIEMIAA